MFRPLLAALAILTSLNLHANDVAVEDAISLIDASSNQEVIVSPIPQPAPLAHVLKPLNPMAKLRAAKKEAPQAKARVFPAVMLSRAERQQMALLLTGPKKSPQGKIRIKFFDDDDDDDNGYEDLPLHQFYSRPRLVRDDESNYDDTLSPTLFSDNVRIRLLMARLKAVEAHALTHVSDDGVPLSEGVQTRLAAARAKALARHAELHRG